MTAWEYLIAYMRWAIDIGVGIWGLPGPLAFALALFAPVWTAWVVGFYVGFWFERWAKEMWDA